MSQVKISGMEINVNTITTLQQNKTLNSMELLNSQLNQIAEIQKDIQHLKRNKSSQFKNRKDLDPNEKKNIESSFVKKDKAPIEESKSVSDSNSVSPSSGSEVVRLFKNGESPKLDDEKENFSEEEKYKTKNKKDKSKNKENELFPSFESDERDENVPKLCNNDKDLSVSDDSIEDIINIKIFTYRRNLLVKEYILEPNDNYNVMHSSSRYNKT